ncbi:hypothetical protein Dsin_023588 [Dipteronia sinensis]|uniref:Fe-S metabolism associated domain-containing protein n=1 Tax=Dipteronia sinensis TaxID=43782 RepID=A0AAE0A3K3_9ROSI|nr:hypothetical protein Dsin_023588 [Dipteronia sinensis]
MYFLSVESSKSCNNVVFFNHHFLIHHQITLRTKTHQTHLLLLQTHHLPAKTALKNTGFSLFNLHFSPSHRRAPSKAPRDRQALPVRTRTQSQVPSDLILWQESQVWVRAYLDEQKNVVFEADSDSVLTKGLSALLVQGLSNRPVEDIVKVSPDLKNLGCNRV